MKPHQITQSSLKPLRNVRSNTGNTMKMRAVAEWIVRFVLTVWTLRVREQANKQNLDTWQSVIKTQVFGWCRGSPGKNWLASGIFEDILKPCLVLLVFDACWEQVCVLFLGPPFENVLWLLYSRVSIPYFLISHAILHLEGRQKLRPDVFTCWLLMGSTEADAQRAEPQRNCLLTLPCPELFPLSPSLHWLLQANEAFIPEKVLELHQQEWVPVKTNDAYFNWCFIVEISQGQALIWVSCQMLWADWGKNYIYLNSLQTPWWFPTPVAPVRGL